jgi:hypothetical protein
MKRSTKIMLGVTGGVISVAIIGFFAFSLFLLAVINNLKFPY